MDFIPNASLHAKLLIGYDKRGKEKRRAF